MVKHMEKRKIIELKEEGKSNREVSRQTGYGRDTVSRYWNEYRRRMQQLTAPNADVRAIQDSMFATPKRAGAHRIRTKYTEEVDARLKGILKEEDGKTRLLGANHKQKLTNRQIHQKLKDEGFDVSEATINAELAKIRKRQKEVFIRQEYDLGDRLEYDFGEVELILDGIVRTCHMAVLSSPGGDFRWLYLYSNQKKAVFMDSHVRFFEMMGGSYREVVYDNMRNVVKKFIGKNEKELNEDLVKMSMYYGFRINVTNCFKGNEKGHVESSVRILRNQIFAEHYTFNTLEDAQAFACSRLIKLNEGSSMEAEKQCLLTLRPFNENGTWAAKSKKEYVLDDNGERIRLPSGEYKSRKIPAVDWNDKSKAEVWRSAWADAVNGALEKHSHSAKVDHRSYSLRCMERLFD
jgi:transposase